MATEHEFVTCANHPGLWLKFCGKCAKESAVPAPPTRTEKPEKLTEVEILELRHARVGPLKFATTDKAHDRLAFLEAEREKQKFARSIMPDEAQNWTPDAPHENGNYMNTCVHCQQSFMGHKRRVVCRVCASPQMKRLREHIEEFKQQAERLHKVNEVAIGGLLVATAKKEVVPDYWRCRSCGCVWRDNHDGTVSLGSAKQTSCNECEWKPSAESCDPLYKSAPERP